MGRASGPSFFATVNADSNMNNGVITRWRAAAIHLGLSALAACAVLSTIYFFWYPGALFNAAGGLLLFLLITGVNVASGPRITLIIFRQGKKGLRFDLATIALLQLAALSYGTWVLYQSRPVWIAFVVDRFELVRANEVPAEERAKAKPPYDQLPLSGPRVIGVRKPKDPNEQFRVAMSALQGHDLQGYPQYYVPYADVAQQVVAAATPVAQLSRFNPDAGASIAALPTKFGVKDQDLGFLPMRAGKKDLTVLVDRRTGRYLGTSELKPWQY
jgi:hypothetical protein